MCAMVANPIPPSTASADSARAALDAAERIAAALDGGLHLHDLRADVEGIVELVGEIAAAATVGVPSAASTLMTADLRLAAALRKATADPDSAALLALEQIRAGLLDLIESQPVRRDLPAGDVLAWLDGILTSDRAELASILGTSRRSLQRWLSPPHLIPPAAIARIRLVARLVNELRFAYEGDRALSAWFFAPKRALTGRRPIDVLDDADAADLLEPLALGARFA